MTAGDLGRLAEVVEAPDSVTRGSDEPGRGPVLRYEKVVGPDRIVALFEVRQGRRRLSLITMWVERVTGASPTATP